ncbi:hypothetical protein [Egicoccus sp. AB-alg2]|uniref:hypothetical protein n=1 Tax=Egicoccus sp. AB-alg2 TaxID=3242693 RepID=UPI00359EEE9F
MRWIELERLYPGDAWRVWLLHELLQVAAREPRSITGIAVIRQTTVEEFPYAARTRPPQPAFLAVAEISDGG